MLQAAPKPRGRPALELRVPLARPPTALGAARGPADMRCQAASSAPAPGTTLGSAKLPSDPPGRAAAEPARGSSKLLTAFYFFFF